VVEICGLVLSCRYELEIMVEICGLVLFRHYELVIGC
jgi:hypothetical protein